MKAALKLGFTALGLILIVIGIGGMVVYTQVERYASRSIGEMLGTSFDSTAHVESISVAPGKKAIILNDVTLYNPEKFKEGEALTCKRVVVQLDLMSLLGESPTIDQLSFIGTDVFYRHEILDGTNIGALAKKFERAASIDPSKFVVKKVLCKDARVSFSSNLIPKADMDLNLVTVELDSLDNGKPVSGAEVTSIFLRSIVRETLTINGLLNPIVKQLRKDSVDVLDEEVKPKRD